MQPNVQPNGARLNVHLVLDEALRWYCLAANTSLRAASQSHIVFGDESPMLPHVTLLMGYVKQGVDPEGVVAILQSVIAREMPGSIELRIAEPRLEEPSGYVLCGVEPSASFYSLRSALCDALSSSLTSEKDYQNEWPHLTLAKLFEPLVGARQAVVQLGRPPATACCAALGLSAVGPAGTCIGRICELPLA